VPEESLVHFSPGTGLKVQFAYPDPENPVVAGTLSVSLQKTDDGTNFLFLHGRKELPEDLAKRLKVGWGRSKNARLEGSSRAFCERTEDRYAFDLSGTLVGRSRSVLPGQKLILGRQDSKVATLYAGDCTRVVGGNCPEDIRGLWDCQLVVVVEP